VASGLIDQILLCRRSSVMADQLDRAKIALGAVQRLFEHAFPFLIRAIEPSFMLTQVLLSRLARA